MRFSFSAGISRTGVAFIRRRRGITHDSLIALAARHRAYGGLTLRPRTPPSHAASVALTLNVSRRFEASSSQMATTSAAAALAADPSTTTKLRHRRGAHRKRGGNPTAATVPPPEAPAPLASAAAEVVAAIDVPDAASSPVLPSIAKGRKKRGKRAAAETEVEVRPPAGPKSETATLRPAVEAVVEEEGADSADADADAIMAELVSSSSSKPIRSARQTPLTAAVETATKAAEEAAMGPGVDAVDDDHDAAVVGVELTKHRRSTRTRSSKRRRGSHDGRATAAEENANALAPEEENAIEKRKARQPGLNGDHRGQLDDLAAANRSSTTEGKKSVGSTTEAGLKAKSIPAATVEDNTSEKKSARGLTSPRPSPSPAPTAEATARKPNLQQEVKEEASGSGRLAEGGVLTKRSAGEVTREPVAVKQKGKRGRKSRRTPPPLPTAAVVVAKGGVEEEEIDLDAAVHAETTATSSGIKIETPAAAPLADPPLADASPPRSSSTRSRRGKRGRAAPPAEHAHGTPAAVLNAKAAATPAVAKGEVEAAIAAAVAAAAAEDDDSAPSRERHVTAEVKPSNAKSGSAGAASTTRLSSFSLLASAKAAGKAEDGSTVASAAAAAAPPTSAEVTEKAATPLDAVSTPAAAAAARPPSRRMGISKKGRKAAASGNVDAVEAAVSAALNADAEASRPASPTPAPTPTATAIASDAAVPGSDVAATAGKRKRGRKPKSAPAPATSVEEAHVEHTTPTPVSQAAALEAPKTTAAALKRLFAASARNGGAASSLAAKKHLAAQIIRRRWQLQQESKGGRAAAKRSGEAPQPPAAHEAAAAVDTLAPAAEGKSGAAAGDGARPAEKPEKATVKRGRPKTTKKRLTALAAAETEEPEAAAHTPAAAVVAATSTPTRGPAAATLSGGTTAASETARDAEVAAAVTAALAMAAMPEVDNAVDESGAPFDTAEDVAAAASPADGQSGDSSSSGADDSTGVSRSLAALVAKSHNVVSTATAAAAAVTARGSSSSSKPTKTNTSGNGGGKGGSSGSTTGGGKGTNPRDTLYIPDHRERVLQIFDQMAEINNALGERYKALSYSNTVERLKRGDKVFQLLPPNLLPLPEDNPKWTAPVFAPGTEEAVMAAAQRRARDVEDNRTKRNNVLSPENLLPGVGQKLRLKIVEILETGDLAELHTLEAEPPIRAIRELTQVHGFGPRTAIEFFKKYNITTVKELQDYAVKKGELDMSNKATGRPAGLAASTSSAHKAGFHLNDAQRVGLVYHKDMCHRIPHDEGRLHEAFMKLRLRKYLGKDYELVVCGSYRRKVDASGDIDVLLTRTRAAEGSAQSGGKAPLPPSEVLAAFLNGLKTDRYIEATLAQGPTKFMGLCRLRALPPPAGSKATAASPPPPRFRARRLDVRYVDANCFPAAMLYFTGSKNFNVIMRVEAIKKRCILNEYGLFRKFTRKQQLQRQVSGEKPYNLHEMITRVARFGFASIRELMAGNTNPDSAAAEEAEESATTAVASAGKKLKKKSKEKTKAEMAELCEVARIVEKQRIKAFSEKEIFDALDMDYVQPKDRNV